MTARFLALGRPAVALLLPGALLLSGCEKESTSEPGPVTVHVKVAPPLERDDVVAYEFARGTTKAVDAVDLYCRVSGYLQRIGFSDGETVAKDKLLFQIDDAPFKAAYDKADASLKVSKANAKFREAELERNKSLPPGAVSKSDLDKSIAAKDEADGMVNAAEASLEKAKLDWQYTKVLSPIAGLMSKRAITEGNLVVADKTLLSTIVSEEEMYVEFNIDEQIYNVVQQKVRKGRLKMTDKKNIPVVLKLGNEPDYSHAGQLNFIDNAFGQNTGTILLRAKFPNPKPQVGARLLTPGMSVEVRLPIGEPERALLVAERCIGSDLDQKYVYVMDDKNPPQKRMVKLGVVSDGLRVVEEGLSGNDQVIVVGQQNALRPGVKIEIEKVQMTDFTASRATANEPAKEQPAEKKPDAVPAKEPEKK